MLYKVGRHYMNIAIDPEHGIVYAGHIDRVYQAQSGAWVPEDADIPALTCAKHPVMKGVKNAWNITIDTCKVQGGVVTRLADGVSKTDRARYNEADKAAHAAHKWVKRNMAGKRSQVLQTLRYSGKLYLGVTIVLQPSGAWLAVSHEGIVS